MKSLFFRWERELLAAQAERLNFVAAFSVQVQKLEKLYLVFRCPAESHQNFCEDQRIS